MGDEIVRVRGACKSFGDAVILNRLDMTVKKSTMYSLLGASGSGKTTLLSCILDIMKLDSGQIHVNLNSRVQIGYMPQESALYEDLNILETFTFFGLLSCINKDKIMQRLAELRDVLQLPGNSKKVKSISGGEKRRVSLGIALLADPELIVLDEPTVGLDSILRNSVSTYLRNLINQGKTVIITTHYIEEAKCSDCVSFIRGGRLLIEGSPSDLIIQLSSTSLEDVYYHLSTAQEQTTSMEPELTKEAKFVRNNFQEGNEMSVQRISALALKTMYWVRSNLMVFYFIIIMPILIFTIVMQCTRKPTGLKLGYANFEANCSHMSQFTCDSPLSCRFIKKLEDKDIVLIEYSSVDVAREAVKRNNIWGTVRFHTNFTSGVKSRLELFYSSRKIKISNEDEAIVWMDMSNYILSYQLKTDIYVTYLDSIQDWYKSCGWNEKSVHPIIRFEDPIYDNPKLEGLTQTMAPGLTFFLPTSIAIALGAVVILSEKELGTLKRCQCIGMKYSELFISQFIVNLLILTLQTVPLLLYLCIAVKEFLASAVWSCLLLLFNLSMSIIQGFLISTLTDNVSLVLMVLTFYLVILSYCSGMLWPSEGLHWIPSIFVKIVPLGTSMKSFITMTSKGLSIGKEEVYIGFLHTFIWIIILYLGIIFVVKKKIL